MVFQKVDLGGSKCTSQLCWNLNYKVQPASNNVAKCHCNWLKKFAIPSGLIRIYPVYRAVVGLA